MKLEFSQQIFEKYSNIKFNDVFHTDSRTDGRTELYSRFSQFYEYA